MTTVSGELLARLAELEAPYGEIETQLIVGISGEPVRGGWASKAARSTIAKGSTFRTSRSVLRLSQRRTKST